MADYQQVEQALLDAIKDQADKAANQSSGSYAANHAAACASLAEALAWLNAPAQSHGGSDRRTT